MTVISVDSDDDEEERVVMASVRMSVWVVSVVVTSTLTDEEEEPVVTVVVSVTGVETDVSVLAGGVEVPGRSCACVMETEEKLIPTRRYHARSFRVFIRKE